MVDWWQHTLVSSLSTKCHAPNLTPFPSSLPISGHVLTKLSPIPCTTNTRWSGGLSSLGCSSSLQEMPPQFPGSGVPRYTSYVVRVNVVVKMDSALTGLRARKTSMQWITLGMDVDHDYNTASSTGLTELQKVAKRREASNTRAIFDVCKLVWVEKTKGVPRYMSHPTGSRTSSSRRRCSSCMKLRNSIN